MKQSSKSKLGHNTFDIRLPHWGVIFYASAAGALLPWTVYLSWTLPTRQITRDWDVVWGGFDSFIVLLFVSTAYLIAKRSLWVAIVASALGTSLMIDGWFDVLTTRSPDRLGSLILALTIELPISLLSWHFAGQAIQQSLKLARQSSLIPAEETDDSLDDSLLSSS